MSRPDLKSRARPASYPATNAEATLKCLVDAVTGQNLPAPVKYPALDRLADALTAIREREPVAVLRLPLALTNETNAHAHWRGRHKRAGKARQGVQLVLRRRTELKALRQLAQAGRLVVLAVRIAPRRLDDDGATASAKSLRDGIADALGIDDRDERVVWAPVQQERGRPREHAARVEFYARRGS